MIYGEDDEDDDKLDDKEPDVLYCSLTPDGRAEVMHAELELDEIILKWSVEHPSVGLTSLSLVLLQNALNRFLCVYGAEAGYMMARSMIDDLKGGESG